MTAGALKNALSDYYDEEGRLGLWGAGSAIWVPPEITVVRSRSKDMQALYFPIGTSWPELVKEAGDPVGLLREHGWRERKDAGGVIEDLITVAHNPTIPQLVRFVRRWGPVWKCHNRTHGEWCLWSKAWMAHPSRTRCVWSNEEPVELFFIEARRVEAVLLATSILRDSRGVPAEVWERIASGNLSKRDNATLPLDLQRWLLVTTVNQRLALLPDAPALWVQWENRKMPTLRVGSGWGFVRAAWLQVAQLVTDVRGLYICDNCRKPYARTRKARADQHQFCADCGSKASKLLWWRAHRGNAAKKRRRRRRGV